MTPRSRATVTGRIKEPRTLSSPVSRWGHRLLVAHQRNSVLSDLRQSKLINYVSIESVLIQLLAYSVTVNCLAMFLLTLEGYNKMLMHGLITVASFEGLL